MSLAALAVCWGVSADATSALMALLGVGLPAAALLLARRVSARGAAAGAMGLALGMALMRPNPAPLPWADLGMFGMLVAAALVMGRMADRAGPAPVG